MLGAVALLLAWAPAAMAGAISPEAGGSPNADDIKTLFNLALAIGAVVFLGVEGTLIYSLVKYRYRRGGPEAAQIRGNTPLEIGWTAGAALILVVLSAVTFVYLGDIQNPEGSEAGGFQPAAGVQFAAVDQPSPPGGEKLRIGVVGQQFIWRYDYPGAPGELFSYHEMVVPINTTVTLRIESTDVAHSWWIPRLGGKHDALPGHSNETWFKIKEPGVYRGVCAELCGENHAEMRALVRAVPVDEFVAWADQQRAEIKQAHELLAESRRRPQEQAPPGERPPEGEEPAPDEQAQEQ